MATRTALQELLNRQKFESENKMKEGREGCIAALEAIIDSAIELKKEMEKYPYGASCTTDNLGRWLDEYTDTFHKENRKWFEGSVALSKVQAVEFALTETDAKK